jgi:hypothetical protein
MSSSGLRQTFTITLVLTFFISATALGEQVRTSARASAHQYLTKTKELSKTSGAPVKLEKFILKTVSTSLPSQTDAVDSNVEREPQAVLPSDRALLSDKAALSIPVQPLLDGYSIQSSLIEKAYLDAYVILKESNTCSRFFGGAHIATSALNSLYPRLKTTVVENHVGISMYGQFIFVTDFKTGISYRLFQNALVNLRGPFYRSANDRSQNFFKKIGYYPANTREARVTMLLHELGHLLPGADGRWLLPDDGGNHVQTAVNTATIMEKCNEQIKSLPK